MFSMFSMFNFVLKPIIIKFKSDTNCKFTAKIFSYYNFLYENTTFFFCLISIFTTNIDNKNISIIFKDLRN